jgi:hypothetical protein
MGHRFWIGVSGLGLLACGGIAERQVTDDGGASGGGSTSTIPSVGGGTTHHAGGAAAGGAGPAAGGAAISIGGTAAGGAAISIGGASVGGATMTGHVSSGNACYNDRDCPDRECGGEVCNWNKIATNPMGEKLFFCNAAGSQPQAIDGWCTTDADCKCRALGAKCIAPYCSFTRPQDAH